MCIVNRKWHWFHAWTKWDDALEPSKEWLINYNRQARTCWRCGLIEMKYK